MNQSRCAALLLSAFLTLTASAGKDDVAEYAGEALQPDQGVVVMRVEWKREAKGGMAKAITRDDDQLFIVLKDAVGKGKARFVVKGPETIKAFVLPAGRWYLAEMYTRADRNLPKIAKPLQSFQVVADKINYAGFYSIRIVNDQEGRMSPDVSVEFPPEPVQEAGAAFAELFATKELLYCPVGRLCKSPKEFKF